MQTLTVVNDCIGTMGEEPLALITDPHPFKSAALSILGTVDRGMQAKGWWFNTEVLKIALDVDGFINLPADTISIRTTNPDYVQRYTKLYDRANGTHVFTADQTITLLRLVPFEQTPELYGAYAAAETVLRFQKRYDGDTAKERSLQGERNAARIEANAENIRQEKVNLIEANPRLTYIKNTVRDLRGR